MCELLIIIPHGKSIAGYRYRTAVKYFKSIGLNYKVIGPTELTEEIIKELILRSANYESGINTILRKSVSSNVISHVQDMSISKATKWLKDNSNKLTSLLIYDKKSDKELFKYKEDDLVIFNYMSKERKIRRKIVKEELLLKALETGDLTSNNYETEYTVE